MRCMKVLFVALLLLGLAGVSRAADSQTLQQENTQLRRRIERLENAIEDLKKTGAAQAQSAAAPAQSPSDSAALNKDIEGLRKENLQLKQRLERLESALEASAKAASKQTAPGAQPTSPAPAPAPQPPVAPVEAKAPAVPAPQPPATPTEVKAPAAPAPAVVPPPAAVPAPPVKKNVLSSLDIELYGYLKADASYDTSRTYPGNYVVYVDSEAARRNDNEFNMTANQSRVGMRITGPATETFKTSGVLEFDFFGNYAAENKAKLQMRLGYLVLDWPQSQFSILAGQAPDVFSPLSPFTLNYTVLWGAGNIAYRRPQFRATQNIPFNDRVSLKLEAAASRTIGRNDLTGSESGEDAGGPTGQGRVSLTFPFFGPKPTTIGVSGHVGKEEYDIDPTGRNVDFDTQSINVDLTQPVFPWMAVLGEWFRGQNLSEYFGGILQGVNTTTLHEISATGGWLAVNLGPWSQWSFTVGGGADNVDRDDLSTGGRTRNAAVFGNVLYAFNKNAQAGFEVSHWDTNYKGPGDGDDMRAQASFIYKF